VLLWECSFATGSAVVLLISRAAEEPDRQWLGVRAERAICR
jgi:hypothetical protein